MFKRHYRSILVLIVFGVVVSLIVTMIIEQSKIYEVCRIAMLSVESYGTWEHQGTNLFPRPMAIFDDGTNKAWCQVQRDGLEWRVAYISTTPVERFP